MYDYTILHSTMNKKYHAGLLKKTEKSPGMTSIIYDKPVYY